MRNPPVVDPRRTEFRFLLATLLVAGFLSFLVIREFIYFMAFAILLVFAFFPTHRKIRKWVKKPALAASLSLMLVVVVLVGPLVLIGFLVFHDAVNFAQSYDPDRVNETLQPILERFGFHGQEVKVGNETRVDPSEMANRLGDKVKGLAEDIGEGLVGVLPGLLLGLFITLFVIFYGFLDGERFYAQVRHVLPLPDAVEDSLFHNIASVTKAVFNGTILIAVISAIMTTITFLIFGVPNALFWGFIMIILGILPLVGPPLVWVPVGAWKLLEGDTVAGSSILIINTIIGFGYIEHVLRPRVIGKLGSIHPVWVLVGVLGGLEVFGIMGFVLGPLVIAVFIALLRSYTEFHPRWIERRKRGIEPYHPEGKVRPEPFEVEPADDRKKPVPP